MNLSTAILVSLAIHLAILTVPLYLIGRVERPLGYGGVTMVDVVEGEGEGEAVSAGGGSALGGSNQQLAVSKEARKQGDSAIGYRRKPPKFSSPPSSLSSSNSPISDPQSPSHLISFGGTPDGAIGGGIADSASGSPGRGNGVSAGTGSNPILARIRTRIERVKRYPPDARKKGLEGRPVVAFEINVDGSLKYAKLVEKSGEESLDNAALETLNRAAPFPYYEGPIEVAIKFEME